MKSVIKDGMKSAIGKFWLGIYRFGENSLRFDWIFLFIRGELLR